MGENGREKKQSTTSKISIKNNLCTGLKKLTPKQMHQRLSIALTQVKAGNTSENLPHEKKISVKLCILYIKQNKLLKKYTKI